jgi:oligopeptide/dipeptide ABC transporter ATP-binding protein
VTGTSTAVLDIRNLRVGFRRRRRDPVFWALDDVSLTVQRGRTMGLVGESGSGKSTLAKAVLGLAPVHSGRIELRGQDITQLKPKQRRSLGRTLQAVFQDPNTSLNPSYTVGRSLAEPMRAQGISSRQQVTERMLKLLDEVGLDPAAAKRYPRQFSGGQRQRISIARALMTSPEVVIADEAVSALDLSVQAQILNLLADLQDEHHVSYLFISHDLSVVRHICHDVTVLYRGQVMEAGPTSVVTHQPAHPYTRALLLAAPVADPALQRVRQAASAAAATDRPVLAAASTGCPFATRCPFAVTTCTQERPELRPLPDGRSVACHRYPEWLDEAQETVLAPARGARVDASHTST